jgi:hypothetical protein
VIYPLQTSNGLKGTRKLQPQGFGIVIANSQGNSNSASAITTGIFDGIADPGSATNNPASDGGTGNSFGSSSTVGTSNGFIMSAFGQAGASGTSGGNSTSENYLTLLSLNAGTPTTGGGLSGGSLSSVGTGTGASGGNAIFGPSLTTAPTGGGGGGFGDASSSVNLVIASPDNLVGGTPGNEQFFADEAKVSSLATGVGFGVGSGVATNDSGAQAGGSGGGTSFSGGGQLSFDLDDVQNFNIASFGRTASSGGGGAYVGFNPPGTRSLAFISPPSAAGP